MIFVKQVEIVTYQHPRTNHPTLPITNLPEKIKRDLSVIVGHKHRIPPISPGHHTCPVVAVRMRMIQSAGILETRLPSLGEWMLPTSDRGKPNVNLCTLTAFFNNARVQQFKCDVV